MRHRPVCYNGGRFRCARPFRERGCLLPDRRSHRGAHPKDNDLFDASTGPVLRRATGDLCWLLGRGYATPSSLKLVGDRYSLVERQRTAVGRCASSDESIRQRRRHEIAPADLRGRELWLDGYNVLTSVEAALGGGVILLARDGCCRDMASMHGSYRKVAETVPALRLLGETLAQWGTGPCRWLLDRPVSNSGRLKTTMLDVAAGAGWDWQVDLEMDPDPVLSQTDRVVATCDSAILDTGVSWVNLARATIERCVPHARVVDLSVD